MNATLRVLSLLVSTALAAELSAQAIDYSPKTLRGRAVCARPDSGLLGNQDLVSRVVYRALLVVKDADWTRVHFGKDTELARESQIRITALDDGAMQWFEAASLRSYENRSAYFNGNRVLVELLAASLSKRNRVVIEAAEQGGHPLSPLSQCGPTDDRKPSTDPRAGRQYPTGCTSWLIGTYAGLTAGHCTSNIRQTIMFNIPPSSSTGALRFPPVEDQYPYDTSTVKRLSSGVGADWTVFATLRNSNTGLFPGEKQKSWFKLGKIPAVNATIRITGYGVTSPRNARSQTQQTHTGPLKIVRSTSLCYQTDTSGGNSGSPVIDEKTGFAVGIHTHGGCTTRNTGCNSGTRIDRSDLQAAIQQILKLRTVGTFQVFGSACKGSAGTPTLSFETAPELGTQFRVKASGLPKNSAGLYMIGASKQKWGALSLPYSLTSLGAKSCTLYVSIDAGFGFATGTGTLSLGFPIPTQKSLLKSSFHVQLLLLDGAANSAGFTTSNAGSALVGGKN